MDVDSLRCARWVSALTLILAAVACAGTPPAEEAASAAVSYPPTSVCNPEAPPPLRAAYGSGPAFSPQLRLVDERAVTEAMQRAYPEDLRDAGTEGTASVWLLLDTQGRVVKTQVAATSGVPELDRAAEEAAASFHFQVAEREGCLPFWVAVPLTFSPGP